MNLYLRYMWFNLKRNNMHFHTSFKNRGVRMMINCYLYPKYFLIRSYFYSETERWNKRDLIKSIYIEIRTNDSIFKRTNQYGFHSPPPPAPLSIILFNTTTVTKIGNKNIKLNRNTLNENKRIGMVSCSRFMCITNFSDHRRVWNANLLHTK